MRSGASAASFLASPTTSKRRLPMAGGERDQGWRHRDYRVERLRGGAHSMRYRTLPGCLSVGEFKGCVSKRLCSATLMLTV